jgi:hypothetical protein
MDNRDTLLRGRFPPDYKEEPFLELDLREFFAGPLLGRRGQIQVTTKLGFKAADAYRKDQSAFWLWADVQVMTGPDNRTQRAAEPWPGDPTRSGLLQVRRRRR